MFKFDAHIIRRRRISKNSLFLGILATLTLGYVLYQFILFGQIPILEDLVRQVGLYKYMTIAYLAFFAALISLIIPAIHTLFKKKVTIGGSISFDENNLQIIYGKDNYIIPEKELKEIDFEIKKLAPGDEIKQLPLAGGNFMKIPTQDGNFECELDLDSFKQRSELLNMIEFLKIEHDVEVKYKEV